MIILLSACTVADGDLARSAVLGLELEASGDALARRATRVTGTIELAYVSPDLVSVAIEHDGVPVYATSLRADRLEVPIDAWIAPLSEGTNALVARATYLDATATTSLAVDVPPGIAALTLSPPDVPDELATTVSGAVELAFDAPEPARIEVLVEGALAGTAELPGVTGPAAFAVPVQLPHAGANEIVVVATYGEARREASLTVGVAEPVVALDVGLVPAVTTFDVDLTGSVQVGYRSERPATFEVLADGVLVHSEPLDVSVLTKVPLAATVPLAHVGDSPVLARVRYDGAERSATRSVAVLPPEPEVTIPQWRIDYLPSVTVDASGTVEVAAPADWVVGGVRGSMDGGVSWTEAVVNQTGWRLVFLTPDIDQPVVIEVTTASRGIPVSWRYEDVLPVPLIFDCEDPLSMVPSNGLLQDLGVERRTMIGYFGDPDGPHNVSFVLEAEMDEVGPYPQVATVLSRGAFAMDVEVDLSAYGCGNGCVQDYALDVLLDGASDCRAEAFGQITEL